MPRNRPVESRSVDGKYQELTQRICGLKTAAVAFSGGVDSSLLCRVAHDLLGDNAIAITVVSPMLPRSEIERAKALAEIVGIRHILLDEPRIDPEVAANPRQRCYICRKIEFSKIKQAAGENGIECVLDGSNQDDLSDYRPGLRALEELGIASPLRDAGLTKAEVRELSRRLGLPTWDKPAFACLASRVPYGETITTAKLLRIERAEECLRSFGLRQVRVRSHEDLARIEVAREERPALFDEGIMDDVSVRLKSFGFLYVSMELSGYQTGSMNRAIAGDTGGKNG